MVTLGTTARRVLCAVALLCWQAAAWSAPDDATWQRAHVGRVTHAALAGQRACVTTAPGVVACLALRTGEIEWRQVLEEDDAIDGALFTSKAVITLSGSGKLLRAWAATDGALVWEDNIYSSALGGAAAGSGAPHLLLLKDAAHETVATLSRGRVQLRAAADGSVLWDVDASALASGAELFMLATSRDATVLYAAGRTAAGALTGVALNIDSGQLISAGTATAVHELLPPYVALSSLAPTVGLPSPVLLVAADASGTGLGHVDLEKLVQGQADAVGFVAFTAGADALLSTAAEIPTNGLRVRAVGAGLAALETPSGLALALLHVAPSGVRDGMPAALAQWPRGATVGSLTHTDGSAVDAHLAAVLVAHEPDSGLALQVLDAATGAVVHREGFAAMRTSSHGKPACVFLGSYARRNASRGFRVAVTSEDASFALLQQGRVVWTREEALAEVVDVVSVERHDLSLNSDGGGALAFVPALRSVSAVQQLLTNAGGALLRAVAPAASASAAPAGAAGLDGQGARSAVAAGRTFVVLTASGKVLGISSERGDVLWSWWPAEGAATAPGSLLLWRTTHAPLVLLGGPASGDAGTQLTWLEAHTGAVVGSSTLSLRAARMIPLAECDAEGRRVVLLWERHSGRVAVFPEAADASAVATAAASHLYMHALEGRDGMVSGYAVTPVPDGALRAVPAWSVVLHSPVISSSVRPEEEVVFSRTRVRGDRSTAYKYLSPNTLFVATSVPRDSRHAAVGLEVVILDTVTGRFLYRVRHAAATGPVACAAADNWFVYAYWSEAAQRTEVSVLELFEEGRFSGSLSAAVASALTPHGAGWSSTNTSSLAPPTLRVLGQTYSLSAQLAAVGVTTTRRGLTSRHVLLGTRSGRVVALDRRFVDPRRPTRPSASDREEGLVPYSEALLLLPGAHLTRAVRLARLRGIATAPAALESACHVLAYGLDVFHARAAPSQTFDTLGAGFSRVLLAATLTALAAGAAVAGLAVRRDDLTRRWL